MVEIKRFVLHVVSTDLHTKKKEISIKPKNNENMMRMKEDVAKILQREKNRGKWDYWYLVGEIDTPEGKPAYRTVIGKTLF